MGTVYRAPASLYGLGVKELTTEDMKEISHKEHRGVKVKVFSPLQDLW